MARQKPRNAPVRRSAPEIEDAVPEAEWPTARMAAKIAGVSVTSIRNWEESGELRCSRADGVKRYSPVDLRRIAPTEETTRRDLILVLAEESQRLLKLSTEPVQRLFAAFGETLDRQQTRIVDLEKRHLEVLGQYEEALTHRHERDLEIEVTRRQQTRIDHGVRTLEEWLPKLASQAVGRVKVQKVIESLSDAQIQMLREIDAIDAQQLDLLTRIRDEAKKKGSADGHSQETGGSQAPGASQDSEATAGQAAAAAESASAVGARGDGPSAGAGKG